VSRPIRGAEDLPQLPADPVPHHRGSHGASDRERDARPIDMGRAVGVVMGCLPESQRATSPIPTSISEELELPSIRDRVDQALSLCRPLSRRERMTLRPARSDMRCRKPCFFERRRLLGWNVRFTVFSCRGRGLSAVASRRRLSLHQPALQQQSGPRCRGDGRPDTDTTNDTGTNEHRATTPRRGHQRTTVPGVPN